MTGKSQRLRTSDIRCIFYLIGEITELGRDSSRWRLHHRILPLVNARIGFVGEHYICPFNPADTRVVGTVDWGWAPDEQELFCGYLRVE